MREPRRFSWRVIYPVRHVLEAEGFGQVAGIPFLLDSDLNYNALGSRFLIDRALGKWPALDRPLTQVTVRTYANAVCNWLDWCDARSVNPLEAEYQTVLINRYQSDMIAGTWSARGEGLHPNTINHRVGIAIELLQWAADKGMRSAITVPVDVRRKPRRTNKTRSSVPGMENVAVRRGKMRTAKTRLWMPAEETIGVWLRDLYKKPVLGVVEGLIAETVLETALRKAEVAAWRVNTLPWDPADWRIVDREVVPEKQQVLVDIRYGTKGPEYGQDHGDKIGPLQTIRVPMRLALKLHHYRNVDRPMAVAVAMRKGKSPREQRWIRDSLVHLFLNPRTGERYTASRVYDAWRSVPLPQPGWSPHKGRHFWACTTLWRAMVRYQKLLEDVLERKADEADLSLIKNDATSVIQLVIQTQLRHVSQETSLVYPQYQFHLIRNAGDYEHQACARDD